MPYLLVEALDGWLQRQRPFEMEARTRTYGSVRLVVTRQAKVAYHIGDWLGGR